MMDQDEGHAGRSDGLRFSGDFPSAAQGQSAGSVPPESGLPDSGATVPEGEGIHLIHVIPGGTACTYDQTVRQIKADQTFTELLFTQYKDADVAQQMAETNDLVPDSEGAMSIYLPVGTHVYLPEMCYAKSGADSVTLQPTGVPEESMSTGTLLAGVFLVALGIGAVIALFKWVF
jgi:hypothetical protein